VFGEHLQRIPLPFERERDEIAEVRVISTWGTLMLSTLVSITRASCRRERSASGEEVTGVARQEYKTVLPQDFGVRRSSCRNRRGAAVL